MSRQLRYIFCLLLIAGLGFVCGIVAYSGVSSGRIPEGTWIGQLYVGGRTPSEAVELLEWLDGSIQQREVLLDAQGTIYRVSGQSLGVHIDMEDARQLIEELAGSHSLIMRALNSVMQAELDTHRHLPIKYDQAAMDSLCEQIAVATDTRPVNARYDITSQRFVPETQGFVVDRAELQSALLAGLQQVGPITIDVPIEPARPDVARDLLDSLRISTCISSYQTAFSLDDVPRSLNIRRAAELIDSTILLPQQEFSFNERVGPRTREAGFHEAKEIVDSEYVIGIGGGVCQVSSTLYNAAVLAMCDVIERRPHSRVSSYVPAGRDATVYYPAIDLRLRNSLDAPVMISAQVERNVLYIAVLSSPEAQRRVEIATKLVATLLPGVDEVDDATLPAGKEVVDQEAEVGFVVETYRRVYAGDGRLVSDELLSRDTYPPVNRVVRVGAEM